MSLIARLGAENLILISQGQAKLPVKVMLPAKLKMRKSTAACAVSVANK